ncbi:hypothetical protein GIB67_003852 [Kingdonia uniflora]|uniref:Uncharacterized protein n=1 Tax=Kingdonia uniflora TaxID=39325 RepID=A0A7J7NYI8_9MAGN|nr:hypothetical protein GIB67_003852 [Kingdonia uniflora]
MDDRDVYGRGPSSFVIHRELHHRICSLPPNHKQDASYAQLHIYNPGVDINTRHKRNPRLNRYVLQVIQDTLVRSNPFCELYCHAHEVLEDVASEDKEFNVPEYHYSISTDHRRYNMPTTDEITVILPGDGSQISGVRYIIMYYKVDQGLMHISEPLDWPECLCGSGGGPWCFWGGPGGAVADEPVVSQESAGSIPIPQTEPIVSEAGVGVEVVPGAQLHQGTPLTLVIPRKPGILPVPAASSVSAEMRQFMESFAASFQQARSPVHREHSYLEQLQRYKHFTFSGTLIPSEAETWFRSIEKTLDAMKCPDD